ncbi:MAG TPA: hypothetical protein PK253_15165 [Spirochaetota bacterium]|nr:hypothetical protein [Spirochaetota bacterium]
MKKLAVTLILPALFAACGTTVEEAYTAYRGTAKIVAIEESHYNPTGNNEYVDIYFDFQPDDPEARKNYIFKNTSDTRQRLFFEHWGNLHEKWVQDTGIKINNVYPAVRYEKRGGFGGAPVFFKVSVLP